MIKRPRYYAKKTVVDGITFDSKRESDRYQTLKWMQEQGYIYDLRMQVRYELLPVQREPDTIGARGGIHHGKVIERGVDYVADFVYIENGVTIVEDAKGFRTPEYIIKRKMMLNKYGIRIRET